MFVSMFLLIAAAQLHLIVCFFTIILNNNNNALMPSRPHCASYHVCYPLDCDPVTHEGPSRARASELYITHTTYVWPLVPFFLSGKDPLPRTGYEMPEPNGCSSYFFGLPVPEGVRAPWGSCCGMDPGRLTDTHTQEHNGSLMAP